MPERVGPYQIIREVGRGGMGVVHLARDTRLDRDVAIKALPEHLAGDPARLERFEREARTLASLQHPNVAGIYGVEVQDGARYLVLEYVDGETLADMLDRGALSPHDAVEIAAQVAAGVEAAHEAGVIHRDLKPANIKVTPDGAAKVLDFGLARVEESSSSVSSTGSLDSPTLTAPPPQHSPTIPGAILGTAAYMSPEQARGRRLDKRTDVWSFGVVLYEMLVGVSPFAGETASDSLGAVLHKDVDLTRLPAGTPANVVRALERCLARDKAERYRDIGDVRLELLRGEAATAVGLTPGGGRGISPALAGALLVVAAALAGAGAWFAAASARDAPEPVVRKFDVVVADRGGDLEPSKPKISPDGQRVAFLSDNQIHVRDLTTFDVTPVAGSEDATAFCWSPDGRWFAFTKDRGLFKVLSTGGGTTRLNEVTVQYHPVWLADDRILISVDTNSGGGSLMAVPARGGEPEVVLGPIEGETFDYHAPASIPGTDVLLYVHHKYVGDTPLEATDGERRVVLVEGRDLYTSTICWSPSGHILFTRGFTNTSLWALPFSPERLEATGDPFLVLEGADHPTVSSDGTLAAQRGVEALGGKLVWLSESGDVERIGEGGAFVGVPLLSPDGRLLAFSTGRAPSDMDVWVRDMERGFNSRVSYNENFSMPMAWSEDSTKLAIVGFNPGGSPEILTQFLAADGSGEVRDAYEGAILAIDRSWTYAVLSDGPREPNPKLSALRLDDMVVTDTVVQLGSTMPGVARLSPDGSLMLYVSSDSGTREIFCTPFPEGGSRAQVSIGGGVRAEWAPDGSAVYYLNGNELFRVSVQREPELRFGQPELVLEGQFDPERFDMPQPVMTEDGPRFISIERLGKDEQQEPILISIVEHWYEEFREHDER